MLTRLKIQGFKNLRDVDLRFGFFTCIAGSNGVGKSNLFDAIQFLSHLSSHTIQKAASLVRGVSGRYAVLSDLFGPATYPDQCPRIRFVVEAVVARVVKDDYGQDVTVRSTCMEYTLTLKLIRSPQNFGDGDRIEIEHEELTPRTVSSVKSNWKFAGNSKVLDLVDGKKTNHLISTKEDSGVKKIWLHSDFFDAQNKTRLRTGAPTRAPLSTPKTVLSSVDSAVHASHLAMKREMQSWRLLQLEPTALRQPDSYTEDSRITERGEHLPAALRRIRSNAEVALDVSDLIKGVRSVEVVNNDVLQLRTLSVKIGQTLFPASSLSDGTLRFLALSILANDPDAQGLICMEEPENGIHPSKIADMIGLVRRLSDHDSDLTDDFSKNGLRQVIINTHSPLVVEHVPADDLLFASATKTPESTVEFFPLLNSWRARLGQSSVVPGDVRRFVDGFDSMIPRTSRKKALFDAAGVQQRLDFKYD